MTLPHRAIDVSFTLGANSFQEAPGNDTVMLSGLRVSARVRNSGAIQSAAEISVWGMTPSQMAQLSTLGVQIQTYQARWNLVTIQAGNTGENKSVIFRGTIFGAAQIFESMPDGFFHVVAKSAYYEALKPIAPTSFKGYADVATILSGLAAEMNRGFNNYGVNARVFNPYYSGTAYQQAYKCAEDSGIFMHLDPAIGTLDIWPPGGDRGGEVVVVSPDTGLIGYPTWNPLGVTLKTVFSPNLRFGSKFKLQSSLAGATGTYVIHLLNYELDSEIPGGAWFADLQGHDPSVTVVAT